MRSTRRFVSRAIWVAGFVATCLGLAAIPVMVSAERSDPDPSPLFTHSLRTSVDRFGDMDGMSNKRISRERMRRAAEERGGAGAVDVVSTAGQPPVLDCFNVPMARIGYTVGTGCGGPVPIPIDLSGQVIQRRDDPPLGPPIPIEIVSLSLVSVNPIQVDLWPAQSTFGQVIAVPGPTQIGWFLRIRDFNTGQNYVNTQPFNTQGNCNQFPQINTNYTTATPPITLHLESDPAGLPVGCLSFFDIFFELPCPIPKCIYRLTCANGPADELAQLGLCVGDERTGPDCPGGTCPVEMRTTVGSVCLIWTFVACAPSTAGAIPGGGAFCQCDEAQPTMPSSPTCPGEVTCSGTLTCATSSCQGAATCDGFYTCMNATCAAIQTCQAITCTAELTCAGSLATCSPNYTCEYYPTCPGTTTCQIQTCVGWLTCRGSSTCHGAVTCNPPPTYEPTPVCGQPTQQGQHTCHWSPTCRGFHTCAAASCAGSETCQSQTCSPASVCSPFMATSAARHTCQGNPSCSGTISCGISVFTCIGSETCEGSGTCPGAPTCDAPPTLQGNSTCQPTQCTNVSCAGQNCWPTVACDPSCAGAACPTSIGAPSCLGGNCPTIFGAVSCQGGNCATIGGPSCALAACPTQAGWLTCRRAVCQPPTMQNLATCAPNPCMTMFAGGITCHGAPQCQPTVGPTPSCGGAVTCPNVPCTPTMPGNPTCAQVASCAPNPTCNIFGASCAEVATCAPAATCGGGTCADQGTCPGAATCNGTATCPGAHTCAPNPSCRNVATCDNTSATCTQSPTCNLSGPTCGAWPTCNGTPTCEGTLTCGLQPTCDLTCGPTQTCQEIPTCGSMQTCHFQATCLNWPTCQAPAFGTHNKVLMLSREGRAYDSFFDVFTDIYVTDDWHEGPVSPVMFFDPGSQPFFPPPVGSFFDVFVDFGGAAKIASGSPQESLYVDTQLPHGKIIAYRDVDGDQEVSVGDYVLIEFANGESVWHIVTQTGTNGAAKDAHALVHYFELVIDVPPPPPGCGCDCFADPAPPVCDGVQSVIDVVEVINVAFRGAPPVVDPNANCPYERTNVNCDAFTSVLDVVSMIDVAFRGADPAVEFCDPCP